MCIRDRCVRTSKSIRLLYCRSEETKDEPFAWEAREFLRKKLVGESILFTLEKPPNAAREYSVIYLGKGKFTEKLQAILIRMIYY